MRLASERIHWRSDDHLRTPEEGNYIECDVCGKALHYALAVDLSGELMHADCVDAAKARKELEEMEC